MVLNIDRWIEGYETALSKEKNSHEQIIKRCKNHSYCISKKGFYNILNLKGKIQLIESKNEKMTANLKAAQIQINI